LLDQQNKQSLISYLEQTHGYDLAQDFLSLTEEEQAQLYTLISYEQLAEIVSYLDSNEAAIVLSSFDLKHQKTIVEFMEPDDAVDIIQELEDDEQEALISTLDKTSDVLDLIEYDEDETGSLMTTQILTLNKDLDVRDATKIVIKEAPEVETITRLFIIDEQNHFLGVVFLRDLLKAKPPLTVESLMEISPFVYDRDLVFTTIQKINQYNIYEMPVCNQEGIILGMITLDDALDAYEEEAQDDFEKLAALPVTVEGSPIKIALHRFPWLLLLLFVSIPVSLLTNMFHEVITMVAIIVIFQPMISGAAGNVATQTLAVTLKSFANEEKQFYKNGIKEIITGLINGIAIGILAFIITYLFSSIQEAIVIEPLKMATIVSVSLVTTVVLAPIIAILVPSILKMVHLDPAVASGPLITTFLDITTVFVYFGLATLLIGVIL
ncbi:MAG: magnesium transporter, partial [Acholeplasmataceae bacterium]